MQNEFLPGARAMVCRIRYGVEGLTVFLFREPDVAFVVNDPRPDGIDGVRSSRTSTVLFRAGALLSRWAVHRWLGTYVEEEVAALARFGSAGDSAPLADL